MKKKLSAFLALLVCVSLFVTACGNKDTAKNNTEKTKEKNVAEISQSEVIKASDPSKLPEAAKARKDTLVVGFTPPEGKLSPIYSSSADESTVTGLIFGDGLVDTDEKGLPIPGLAEKWEVSEDNKTYTFYMKKGVKFSNGEEITADDIAFTYTAIADPAYDGPRMDAVKDFLGYEEYNQGDAATVEGIKVIDEYTISFTLKNIKAPAIYDFGYAPLCKSYYNFEKGQFAKHKEQLLSPMGAGPYTLKEYLAGQSVSLEANKDYWKGSPKIKNIIFKGTTAETQVQELVTGGVDIQRIGAKPENINKLKGEGFIELQLYPENGYGYIGLNTKRPQLSDKRVRQALVYAINRQGFVDLYFKGNAIVMNTALSPVSWAYSDKVNPYPYDSEKAKELLDEAGWAVGKDGYRYKDGEKLKLSWLTYTGSKYVETLIPIVQNNLKEVGVEVVPELMEFGTLSTKVYEEQDFDMYNMAWTLSIDPDPMGIFGKEQCALGGFNSVSWAPDKSVELMKAGLVETDQEKRTKIYQEWAELINDEAPYIFLDAGKEMMAISSRVKGVNCATYVSWQKNVHLLELVQ